MPGQRIRLSSVVVEVLVVDVVASVVVGCVVSVVVLSVVATVVAVAWSLSDQIVCTMHSLTDSTSYSDLAVARRLLATNAI